MYSSFEHTAAVDMPLFTYLFIVLDRAQCGELVQNRGYVLYCSERCIKRSGCLPSRDCTAGWTDSQERLQNKTKQNLSDSMYRERLLAACPGRRRETGTYQATAEQQGKPTTRHIILRRAKRRIKACQQKEAKTLCQHAPKQQQQQYGGDPFHRERVNDLSTPIRVHGTVNQ